MVTIGERVGSYRVVRAIGSGGMGMVFEAVHERIRSRAAIKILHAQFSENPEVRERFLTEALATNLVQHPGIVSVFEHGQLESGAAYIIMEYLEGDSLRARIDSAVTLMHARAEGQGPGVMPAGTGAPLDRATTLRLMRQLASAMAAAHQKGIVHRDLKPENIMIVKDPFTLGGERVKILDFGIAKVLGPDGARGRTGGLLGTPAYMAPEAWAGAATVDEKADVYSLGIILFEALTGKQPFEDARNNVLKWQNLHETVAPQSLRTLDASIPEALDALVGRMLAKRLANRPDMTEVAAELERLVGLNLRFRAGGFVREGEFYAKRAADEALFYSLLNGQSCYVLAPRQIGKTSLMHSVAHRLTNVRGPELERGVLCVILDLLSVESSGVSEERFYFELVRELYRGLGLGGIPSDFWVDNQERAPRPSERFALLLREAPAQLSQPAVIFIDHVEVLLRLPLGREEFFAALASMLPGSADDTEKGKATAGGSAKDAKPLAFCVLGTALKEELMSDERRSPFGRGRAVALGDLTSDEARVMLPGLHTLGAASEKALQVVLDWTGGHPCLTQRLCEALGTKPLPDGSVQRLVDSVAGEATAQNRRREEPSFAFAEEGVRRSGALRPAILRLYRQVLEGKGELAGSTSGQNPESLRAAARLDMLGLVRREGATLRVRSRMFAAVFSPEWLSGEEAVRPIQLPLEQWLANDRHRDYLLVGARLRETLAWARGQRDLSVDEQAFVGASVEREQSTQRQRIGLLLGAVLVLLASLVGTGWAWQNVRLAKQQVELQQSRTEAALREAERARSEAENARNKTMVALRAADEARRAADEARVETEGALSEVARQKGVASTANQRARAATEKALAAARDAQTAGLSAQEASQRAAEAKQDVGRAQSEKAEAIAVMDSRLQQCDRDRHNLESTAQRCQQGLDGKEAEVQSLRGNVGTLNSQVASLSTQVATINAQLASCRSSVAQAAAAAGTGSGTAPAAPAPEAAPAANPPAEGGKEPRPN